MTMWTPEIVKARFIEACDTERRMPLQGNGGASGYWPGYVHSFEDMAGWGTKRLAEERELRMRRIPPSAAAITRHSEVMQWTSDFVKDERRRQIVWAWAFCQMAGKSFASRCRREGWVKMTAYRRLNSAFDAISACLAKNSILLRMPDEKWVLPEHPISATDCETIAVPRPVPTFQIFDGDRPRDMLTSPQAIAEFEKHLSSTNERRRKMQEREAARRKKLGIGDAA